MGDDPLLVGESIGKLYGGRAVLTSAYLRAAAGRVTALVGRNGSGKTTLLKIAAGLTRPTHGHIRYDGTVSHSPRLWSLARRGLFFLSADSAFLSTSRPLREYLTAIDDRARATGHTPEPMPKDLRDRSQDSVRTLSTGERRLFELMLAERTFPRCVLADEPFRELSPQGIASASAILQRLKQRGCAIVVSGHDVNDILPLADEVIWVVAGTTHLLGSPAQALENWEFKRGFLGKRSIDA